MGQDQPPPVGILESFRRLGRTGLTVLQNRLDLFRVELTEQKIRLVRMLMLGGAAFFLGNTALIVISATIVALAGEGARIPVLIGLSLIYAAATLWAFLALRKEIHSSPPPFQETLAELKKDRDWLDHPQN
jgi:uncharacterized membrane protein YqjE